LGAACCRMQVIIGRTELPVLACVGRMSEMCLWNVMGARQCRLNRLKLFGAGWWAVQLSETSVPVDCNEKGLAGSLLTASRGWNGNRECGGGSEARIGWCKQQPVITVQACMCSSDVKLCAHQATASKVIGRAGVQLVESNKAGLLVFTRFSIRL
jgi:hypothetical protein